MTSTELEDTILFCLSYLCYYLLTLSVKSVCHLETNYCTNNGKEKVRIWNVLTNIDITQRFLQTRIKRQSNTAGPDLFCPINVRVL